MTHPTNYPYLLTHDGKPHFSVENVDFVMWEVEPRAGHALHYRRLVDFDGEVAPQLGHGWRNALPLDSTDNRLWLTQEQGYRLFMLATHSSMRAAASDLWDTRDGPWAAWQKLALKFAREIDASFLDLMKG